MFSPFWPVLWTPGAGDRLLTGVPWPDENPTLAFYRGLLTIRAVEGFDTAGNPKTTVFAIPMR
jgi:hypothetical protein